MSIEDIVNILLILVISYLVAHILTFSLMYQSIKKIKTLEKVAATYGIRLDTLELPPKQTPCSQTEGAESVSTE